MWLRLLDRIGHGLAKGYLDQRKWNGMGLDFGCFPLLQRQHTDQSKRAYEQLVLCAEGVDPKIDPRDEKDGRWS